MFFLCLSHIYNQSEGSVYNLTALHRSFLHILNFLHNSEQTKTHIVHLQNKEIIPILHSDTSSDTRAVTSCQLLVELQWSPSSPPHTDTIWTAPSQSQAFREAPLCGFLTTTYSRTWRNSTPLLSPLMMHMTGDCFLNSAKHCNSQPVGNIAPNCAGGP